MNNKSLELFGGKREVTEMTGRLTGAMQGSKKLTPEQAKSLAMISVAHGLDPFNGEAWFIPGSGVMVGIKGLRKMARKQIEIEGGKEAHFWTEFIRIMDPKEYSANDEDLVVECHLRDTETLKAWGVSVKYFQGIGLSLEEATKAAGNSPITIGVGVVEPSDPSKMQRYELVRKRAEASALKQRFDVDFLANMEVEIDPDIDLEIIDVEAKETRTANEAIAELGFTFSKEQVAIVFDNTFIADFEEAQRFLVNSGLGLRAKPEKIEKFCKDFNGKIDADQTEAAAFKYAKLQQKG
jgi:hypothetical protein